MGGVEVTIFGSNDFNGKSVSVAEGCANATYLKSKGIFHIRSVRFPEDKFDIFIYSGSNCDKDEGRLKASKASINLNDLRGLPISLKVVKK